jgi:hypothetical protein
MANDTTKLDTPREVYRESWSSEEENEGDVQDSTPVKHEARRVYNSGDYSESSDASNDMRQSVSLRAHQQSLTTQQSRNSNQQSRQNTNNKHNNNAQNESFGSDYPPSLGESRRDSTGSSLRVGESHPPATDKSERVERSNAVQKPVSHSDALDTGMDRADHSNRDHSNRDQSISADHDRSNRTHLNEKTNEKTGKQYCCQLLSSLGWGSVRETKGMMRAGRIKIDGCVITSPWAR